jgi:ubiquitin conjugation factor E4 B
VPDSPEQLTDRILSSVLRITVRPDQKTDAFGNKLTFLPGVKAELESDGKSLLLGVETLDTAIIEAGSHTPDGKPFGYLLASFKRIMRAFRTSKHGDPVDIRNEVLKEAKRMCFSYCIFAATMPYMFDAEETERNVLADYFLKDPDSDGGICPDFLTEAMLRWPGEDDAIKNLLVGAVEQISADLSKMTMNDNYKPSMLALRTCSLYPTLLDALTQSSKFLPADVPIERFEYESILGPFFSLSPLHPNVALSYFMGSEVQGQSYVTNNQNAVRLTLRTHQDELLEITNRIVKSGKGQRERMLDWFAHVINKNHKRRATWRDDKIISTDGFMVNITTILDRLCEPFMDHTFSKVDRIDVNYLRRNPRVEINDETKINADQKASDEFYATTVDGESNFISEVFFLTVAAHHYGTEALHAYLTKLEREVKHFEKEVAKMELQRARYATVSTPLSDEHL